MDIADPASIAVISAISIAVGAVLTQVVNFFKEKWTNDLTSQKQADDKDKSETEQALGMYRDLIEEFKTDIKELNGYLHQLEKEHLACREENASLRAEIKGLTARVQQLEASHAP